MALRDAGGASSSATLPLDTASLPYDPYIVGSKRRVSCGESFEDNAGWIQHPKRPKYAAAAGFATSPGCNLAEAPTPAESFPAPARDAAFFVRSYQPSPAPSAPPDADRDDSSLYGPGFEPEPESEPAFDYAVEHGPSCAPSPLGRAPGAAPMERTASGLSISSGITQSSSPPRDPETPGLLSDLEAAQRVHDHLAAFTRRSRTNSRHERILRALINPRTRSATFTLDDAALSSIFSAANAIFFASRLSNRVAWDWSHEEAAQYTDSVIGTTALRRCRDLSGFETLIVLSRPILRSRGFSRRLLISTFLHELIHSYLFVSCGFKAKESGGHTEGFHKIAAMIDGWAGPELLRLQEMEADLESYREDGEASPERQVYPQSQGCLHPYELHQETPSPLSDPGRFPTSTRHSDDSHIPVLREQPHRLLQSRSQTSLRRRLYDESQHAHQYPYPHHDTQPRHHRQDQPWEGWVDDRWRGGPAQEKTSMSSSVPILVRVSVPKTVPIRASLEPGVGAGGVYAEYDS